MKVYSVIVSYNPNETLLREKVEVLLSCGVSPVIVNNSSYCLSSIVGSQIIELGDNHGIAFAQNKGIEFLKSHSADVVMFFDQDSVINEDLVNALIEPISHNKARMTAPVFEDERRGFFYKLITVSKIGRVLKFSKNEIFDGFLTNAVISSGHTVHLSVFDTVGAFDNGLFIDYVDTEWCLRASSSGFMTYICTGAKMVHSIGDNVIDFKFIKIPVHSPYRRYYRIRNSFLLFRKSHIPFLLAFREVLFSLVHQFILILLCKDRLSYFKYLVFAVFDGFRGKVGKLN